MNFCSHCGSQHLVWKIPVGDHLPRHVCEECETIFYQNPKIVTGCLAEWEDKILLCKRAIEPRYGLWTLPAGFMENHETIENAAIRETWEEAQAQVDKLALYTVISLPDINQVYMMFRCQLKNLAFSPGSESLAVELFTQEQIPWETLAFPVIQRTLNYYYQDRAHGHFPLHLSNISRRSQD